MKAFRAALQVTRQTSVLFECQGARQNPERISQSLGPRFPDRDISCLRHGYAQSIRYGADRDC